MPAKAPKTASPKVPDQKGAIAAALQGAKKGRGHGTRIRAFKS